MAMTSERRSTYPLCGARKKSGGYCRAFAGQATEHLGVGRCKYHGGSTRSHQVHAATTEAKRRLASPMGQAVEMHPHEALVAALHLSAGRVAWLRDELADGDQSPFETAVLLNMYASERDRLARTAKAAIDSGLEERRVQLAESMGEQLAAALRRVFDSAELALTTDQRQQ